MVPAPDLWSMLHRDGSDSTRHLLPHQRLLLYGLGLQRRPALLPRDRQSAPESAIFRARHSTGASLSSRKATK